MKKRKARMVNIPHEIIVDILSRLPVKSLLKFKCVSKVWQNLISDSSFFKMHLTRAIENDRTSLIATKVGIKNWPHIRVGTSIYNIEGTSFDKLVEIRYPVGEAHYYCRVLGSCNGIVCFGRNNVLCLLNPSTREYKIVEYEKEVDFDEYFAGVVYGFGYDPFNDDYNLVQFVNSETYNSRVNVFTLGDSLCYTISDIPYTLSGEDDLGIFLNGALYWLGHTKTQFYTTVISFDVGKKVFREVLGPVDVIKYWFKTLGELGGQLCMLCMYDTTYEIWIMKNCSLKDSWSKFSVFEESAIHKKWPNTRTYQTDKRPLCFAKNGEVLLKDKYYLVLYNPKQKTARYLDTQGILGPALTIVTYVASLTPLKSGSYVGSVPGAEVDKQAKFNFNE